MRLETLERIMKVITFEEFIDLLERSANHIICENKNGSTVIKYLFNLFIIEYTPQWNSGYIKSDHHYKKEFSKHEFQIPCYLDKLNITYDLGDNENE